jgi:hypothetical protein
MSRVSAGQREVTIGGHDYTLKVTISAIEQIERRFGDFQSAARKCMSLGWGDAIFILAKGAGLDKSGAETLKHHALSEGLESIATLAAEYLSMVINPNGDDEDVEQGEV